MLRSPDRQVVSRVLSAGDPCAQDEVLFDEGNLENCVRYGAPCVDPEAFAAEERRFHTAYLGVLAGERAWSDPDLLDSARLLGLDAPRWHDTRPPRLADAVLPDAFLCDVVEDCVPEVQLLVERVTGVPEMPRRPCLGAVAALAYVYCGIDGTRPLDGWLDDEDDAALRQAARVVEDAPVGVWWRGESLLPIVPRWRPPVAAAEGLPELFVARAYPVRPGLTPTGWAYSGVMPLPAVPDPARLGPVLERRLMLELWRLRRTERRSTFEDVLRKRPEVVYRTAGECCALWSGNR